MVLTESVDLFGTGPLEVISSVVDGWIVSCLNLLATGHLVDLEARAFVVRFHPLQNTASQSASGEAFPYHTGVDIEMNVDGIRSNGVQVVSEGRYDDPGEQFLEHPTVRNFEVSAGCKEV